MSKEEIVYFAKTNFRGTERSFGIRTPDRRQHMYIIGKTGTGKTNLIKNLSLQDINNGKGVAIVDPHGEYVEEVLASIPEHRIKDVVYFNPADTENPIGFNILEVTDPKYKHLIASDLMGIFTKIWANVWSARMEYILNNCVLALLDSPGSTLLGIQRMLVDKDYRSKILENVKDPLVRSFWIHEYENYNDRLRSEAIAPIQNKVGQFLSSALIRNIVGQSKSTINISEIMNSQKILLVNVSKGRIGEDSSSLLGAMIITKIQLAAMERVRILEEEREDYYLYVDEFQNFATESFASILSEARKYRLNLTLVHQYINQLVTEESTSVRDAAFGNVGTMITFRVGSADAEFMEKDFAPEFDIEDLVNLPNYNIYIKLMVNGVSSRPFSATTLPPLKFNTQRGDINEIINNLRKLYSRKREEIEEEINEWSVGISTEDKQDSGKSGQTVTQCSHCGKETKVNFKPDGRRPVYCLDCLKKVESGEIDPIPPKKMKKQVKKNKFPGNLGELGIEFEQERSGGAPDRDEIKKENLINVNTRFPAIDEGKPAIRSVSSQTISLNALAPRKPKKNAFKKGPDVPGLRNALKEAFEGQQKKTAGKHDLEGTNMNGNKKTGSKLKPGEKIRI